MLDRDEEAPNLIDYLDLLAPMPGGQLPLPVHAVAEHQGTALLYIVDASDGEDPRETIPELQRRLANRSDPAWLGVARPGSLEIYPIQFKLAEASPQPVKTILATEPAAPQFFQSLVQGTFLGGQQRPQACDAVYERILTLLKKTTQEYLNAPALDALDILSLCGRSLFFRFLIDRRIVVEADLQAICPMASGLRDVFSSPERASHTSAWLDATFNGDFLPLIDESIPSSDRAGRGAAYRTYFEDLQGTAGQRIFLHLQAILNGWRVVEGGVQQTFDWGDLDFAHIPVGVLSQVYESFCHQADPEEARRTSVHYTPRVIARLMVDEVFASAKAPAAARVLDPACGAGTFLVLAFRRLVAERWRLQGKRPDTAAIHDILYHQIRGFDISRPALRLAALSLYITAIEVNGSPSPPEALKFPRNLGGEVLHLFEGPEVDVEAPGMDRPSLALGSLGSRVPKEFDNSFDIVIGNPPWTRLREDADRGQEIRPAKRRKDKITDHMDAAFTQIGSRALRARGLDGIASGYKNPDKNPDLPFLWRATEWAREGGQIAFVLPARVFLHATERGSAPWMAVLEAVHLTGLINGSDLRKTGVWDGMDIPWCLLFARNTRPPAEHRFYYLTPRKEVASNRGGRFRIDYESARLVEAAQVRRDPSLLKTLSLGIWRDVELVGAIRSAFPQTLREVWNAWDPEHVKTGKGYDRSPNLPQKSAAFLGNLKVFEPAAGEYSIPYGHLTTYEEKYYCSTAYRPKTEALYQPPLVIVPQSPGDNPGMPRAYLASESLAFSQSYYGYSCAKHPDAQTLAALLYLLAHSRLFEYFCLMTSERMGADRQTFNKEELDALPFPDVSTLNADTRASLLTCADELMRRGGSFKGKVDELIFRLYGLDEDDIQVLRDTLYSASSYRRAGKKSLEQTTRPVRDEFAETLRRQLEPFFEVCGAHAQVSPLEINDPTQPWRFLRVARAGTAVPPDRPVLEAAMDQANQQGSSRIIVHMPDRAGVLMGLLNENRWWTRTRARLCAQHLILHALGSFGLPEVIA